MSTERIHLQDENIRGGTYMITTPIILATAGAQGNTGLAGPTGVQGMTGVYIAVGTQGVTGLVGQGVTGLIGPTGQAGATGIKGQTGIIGRTGVQGGGGDTGIKGNTGLIGRTGIQGLTGFLGSTGIQGARGIDGLRGHTGISGSTGIDGLHGDTGIYGFTGIMGLTGLALGNTGIQGITGFIGSTGLQGVGGGSGSTGIRGLTGLIGYTGIQGTGGDVGTTGIQGIGGDIGSTGIQGTGGSQGSTGIRGLTGIGLPTAGTQDRVPYYATTSTLGDTYLTHNSGNGSIALNVSTLGTTSLTAWNDESSLSSVNKASNDTGTGSAGLVAYGSAVVSTYQSPSGSLGNNSELQLSGDSWSQINQIHGGAITYLSYQGYPLAHWDNEKVTVDKCLNVGDATSMDARLVAQSDGDSVPIVEIIDNAPVNGNTSIRSLLPQLAHGVTDYLPTTVNWDIRSAVKGTGYKYGGMMIETISSSSSQPTFQLHAIGVADQLYAPIGLYGAIKSGTSQTDVAADDPIYTLTNNATPLITTTGNGDTTFAGKVVTGSAYNGAHLILGSYHIWVDASDRLRIKVGAPTSESDGTIVGLQS